MPRFCWACAHDHPAEDCGQPVTEADQHAREGFVYLHRYPWPVLCQCKARNLRDGRN